MIKKNAVTIKELLRDFMEENPEFYENILQTRVKEAWDETLGPGIAQYTTNIYIKDRILYVSISSSVVRSELMMCRDRLIKSLNQAAESSVIDNIIIR